MAKQTKKEVDIKALQDAKVQREQAKEAVKPVTNFRTILNVV